MYEDADFEDVTIDEIENIIWKDLVPTYKRQVCFKHAKTLCMLHESIKEPDTVVPRQEQSGNPKLQIQPANLLSRNSLASQISLSSSLPQAVGSSSINCTSSSSSSFSAYKATTTTVGAAPVSSLTPSSAYFPSSLPTPKGAYLTCFRVHFACLIMDSTNCSGRQAGGHK